MKKNLIMLICFAVAGCFFSTTAVAGDLDSPAGPEDAGSALYTIEDVYNRLETGETGAKRTGAFTEPTAGPGSTGHTTDDIMGIAPAVDETTGAVAAEVVTGKTFWGLTNGEWGPQTGTAAGTSSCTGDATAEDVLSGNTFSNGTSTGIAGSMTNNGAQTITPGTTDQAIAAGYHDGTGEVAGDADLVSSKIVNGTEIFGVSGTAKVATGIATNAQVLNGVSYSNSGGASTGSMPTQTLSPDNDTVNAGYYESTTLSSVDTGLATGNIRSGVTVFGVAGDPNVVNTSSGDAVGAEILFGKKAWVDGAEVTGSATLTYQAGVPKTGQTTSYNTGDDGDLEKGVAWPTPRFTINLNGSNVPDGTVTDNLTGLIWLKNANAFGARNWATALTDCNGLASGTAGLTDSSVAGDWRLPNVKELQSLIDFSNVVSALPSGHPFTGVQSGYYWSGTTYANGTVYAWYVYMLNGYVGSNDKTLFYYVWPVRGGND